MTRACGKRTLVPYTAPLRTALTRVSGAWYLGSSTADSRAACHMSERGSLVYMAKIIHLQLLDSLHVAAQLPEDELEFDKLQAVLTGNNLVQHRNMHVIVSSIRYPMFLHVGTAVGDKPRHVMERMLPRLGKPKHHVTSFCIPEALVGVSKSCKKLSHAVELASRFCDFTVYSQMIDLLLLVMIWEAWLSSHRWEQSRTRVEDYEYSGVPTGVRC